MEAINAIWSILYWISVLWVTYDVISRDRGFSGRMNSPSQYRQNLMARKKQMSYLEKALWILITLVLGLLGAVLYYIFRKR